MDVKLYGSLWYAGYSRMDVVTNANDFHNAHINDVKIGPNSNFKNTVFSSTRKHTVGTLSGLNSSRVWSVAYTAPANGYVTIPGTNLSVTAAGELWNSTVSYNAEFCSVFIFSI